MSSRTLHYTLKMSAQHKALARANRLLAKRERQGDEAGHDNPRRLRLAQAPGPVADSFTFRNPGRWTMRESQLDGRVRMTQGSMAATPATPLQELQDDLNRSFNLQRTFHSSCSEDMDWDHGAGDNYHVHDIGLPIRYQDPFGFLRDLFQRSVPVFEWDDCLAWTGASPRPRG